MNIVLQLTIRTKTPQDTLSSCLEHCPLTTFHWQLSCPSSYFFVRKLLCKKRTNSITIFHFATRLTSIAEKPKNKTIVYMSTCINWCMWWKLRLPLWWWITYCMMQYPHMRSFAKPLCILTWTFHYQVAYQNSMIHFATRWHY